MKYLFSLLLLTLVLFSPPSVSAAKKRVFGKTAAALVSKNIVVSPKLRRDKGALILNISNLSAAKSISYELTYTGSGQEQGVFGSIDPSVSGNSVSRSLYFGTCSHNVCTPHYGVKNARLSVVAKTTRGTTVTRRYRVKT